jgi:peptide chain release factor subunit 3
MLTVLVCYSETALSLSNSTLSWLNQGFVLCDPNNPIKSCRIFDAQVVVLDYKSIICPGKAFVMHLQAIIEEVTLKALICLVSYV